MKTILAKVIGVLLIVAGLAGLVFTVLGLVFLARAEQQVAPLLQEHVDMMEDTLTTTAEGLEVAEDSLDQAITLVASVETTIAGAGHAIGRTVPLVDSLSALLNERLPATLSATKEALKSVASSAKVIDDALAVVTSLPLIGLEPYDPELPLHQGLENVIDSLDEIPAPLNGAQQGLSTTETQMDELEDDLTTVASDVGQISSSLREARGVVRDYQSLVADWTGTVTTVQASLPGWLRWLRRNLSLALLFLAVAQIGPLSRGWEMVRGTAKHPQ
jgi:methyl-accepting chemotaxis protein